MAVVLVAGCSKLEVQAPGFGTDPDAVRVEASVGVITKTSPLGTPDEQVRFNDGDQIAVSNGSKTVKYKFDGTSWAPVADENGATDYLVWDTPVTFRAWYPASASWDKFSLPTDQSEDIAAADFMTCSAEYKDDAAIPQERKLSLVMTRHMALVTIIIDKIEEQYGDIKDPEFRNAKISSAHASVYRQSDGTYGSAGAPREISPVEHEIGGKTAYSAIVTPGKADNNWGFLRGYIGNDGSGYNDVYVTGLPAAEAGKHYTYKLVIGKETVKIGGVTVEDWTTGFKLDGKFEAEVDDYSEWDGKKVSGNYYFSGKGSETDPYLIKSATDLAGLAANVNAGTKYFNTYFRLETNIDLMGHEWTPIGNRSVYFYGNFDGNGKVITNMTISNATECAGLFGFADGTIQNIVLRNASVASSNLHAALLVGSANGVAIKACKVDGTVHGNVAAGILGECGGADAEILDCEVDVDCYGSGYAGGVFGFKNNYESALVVKNCIVRGRICGTRMGGIAGALQGPDVISGCKSYATLRQADKYYLEVGGIAGSTYAGCKFENCEVYGVIDIESEDSSESPRVGGAIGLASESTISNLKFEGTMNVKYKKEEHKVGAIIGEVQKSLYISSQCTYRKSGTGEFPPVGTYPEEVDISTIVGI